MSTEQTIIKITPDELIEKVTELKNKGCRLSAISCTAKDGLEISYSFDCNYELINLRLNIDDQREIESISSLYSYAFLYENEIKELFGAKIRNINIDFNNSLYKKSKDAPFNPQKEEK